MKWSIDEANLPLKKVGPPSHPESVGDRHVVDFQHLPKLPAGKPFLSAPKLSDVPIVSRPETMPARFLGPPKTVIGVGHDDRQSSPWRAGKDRI